MVVSVSVDAGGMPQPLSPLPDTLPHAAFTTAEATSLGVPGARLGRSDLSPVVPGLWARRERTITEREIVAALCRAEPSAFAAGLTAARLWCFPLPGLFGREVTAPPVPSRRVNGVLVHGPRRKGLDRRIHMAMRDSARRGSALVRWSSVSGEVVRLGVSASGAPSVRLLSRVGTFLSLGTVLQEEALVAIGDHLVRTPRPDFETRSTPYATIGELTVAAARVRGRGAVRVRDAVAKVRVSSDSPPETSLRLAMVRAGLPEPLANAAAAGTLPEGTSIDLGEPDLSWPEWRVALEHEGPSHLEAEQIERDIARGERRAEAGWIELRTTAKDVRAGCAPAIRKVRRALERQGWRPE